MKRIAMMLFAVVAMATMTFAQQPAPARQAKGPKKEKMSIEERVNKQVSEIQAATGCTAEQAAKIKAAATVKFTKMEAIHAKYKGQKEQREAMKAELKPAREEFRAAMRASLDKAQLKKLREAMKAAKGDEAGDYKD